MLHWLRHLFVSPGTKRRLIEDLATNVSLLDSDPSELKKQITGMLNAGEYGLAIVALRTALDEQESVPESLQKQLQSLESEYSDEIAHLLKHPKS